MEGAGFIRSHSEKVELKNNIFAEDEAQDEGADANGGGQAASPPDEDEAEGEDENENYVF